MPASPDLGRLLEMGLTEYEARTYHALLCCSHATASELIPLASVPRGSIYDVLNGLVQKGFCSVIPSKVKKYVAVPPTVAVEGLIEERRRHEARERERWLECAGHLEGLLSATNGAPGKLDYFHVLTSRPGIVRRAEAMENGAREELRSFCKRPYVDTRMGRRPSVAAAIGRGVRDRSLFEFEREDPVAFHAMIQVYADAGVEVRITESLPLKLLIQDDEAVMISLGDLDSTRSSLTSLTAEHSELTAAMVELFETRWEAGDPL